MLSAKTSDSIARAAGKVKADIELQPLTAINEVFDRLQRGDVAACDGAANSPPPVRCRRRPDHPPNPIRVALTEN
jgi:hypothetical protein